MNSRRSFLKTATASVIASAIPITNYGQSSARTMKQPNQNPIGVSTYSFWGFRRHEFRSIEKCLELAANMGFDGVEILQRQMMMDREAVMQQQHLAAQAQAHELLRMEEEARARAVHGHPRP